VLDAKKKSCSIQARLQIRVVLDLISRAGYKKKGVLDTSQTAKRVVLDFNKPRLIKKLTGVDRGKRKVELYNQNKSVAGKGFRKSGGSWMV